MKYFLSFHTVFIMNENIKWLEEFIVYYKHIGFDHFYLYDNEGTKGGKPKAKSKYGFDISTINSEEDMLEFQRINAKYGHCITYEKWQPTNEKGDIQYAQMESISHCIQKYGHETEWLALLDFDEFLFSVRNINIPSFLRGMDRSISCIRVIQKKFLDRFLTRESLISQEFKCIHGITVGAEWAPKNIVRTSDYKLDNDNIHSIKVKHKTYLVPTDILRFNHYNVNPNLLWWMKRFYKRTEDFKIDGEDTGMARYKTIFKFIDTHVATKGK